MLLCCCVRNNHYFSTRLCSDCLLYQRVLSAAETVSDLERPLQHTAGEHLITYPTLVCVDEEYPSLDESKYVVIPNFYNFQTR